MLVECDPAIKAIILKIDQERNEYIVEDLDDTHLMVKDSKVQALKAKLDEVRLGRALAWASEGDGEKEDWGGATGDYITWWRNEWALRMGVPGGWWRHWR